MKNLLYLVHRIPYPPNKGDKIRSFHFLQALASDYRIYLGTFVDDQQDWQYVDELKDLCQETCFLKLNPQQAKILSLQGLLAGKPLTLPYYYKQKMQHWVDEVIHKNDISKVLVFSSAMAQYINDGHAVERFVDFVDVDSDKWRQYAEKKSWPGSWIYKREAKLLFDFEKETAKKSSAGFFVSDQEAQLFNKLAPETNEKITFINNGVDTRYFSPAHSYESPYDPGEQVVVFTGAMDYWANVDAVSWFADQVYPLVLQQLPETKFYIVGSKPTKEVQSLASRPGITVTGAVVDIRPYLACSSLVVAPLRIARGIQNKVLEAMAMNKPVIASPQAIEGIPVNEELDVSIEENLENFAERVCLKLTTDSAHGQQKSNRDFVQERFSWQHSGKKLKELIAGSTL